MGAVPEVEREHGSASTGWTRSRLLSVTAVTLAEVLREHRCAFRHTITASDMKTIEPQHECHASFSDATTQDFPVRWIEMRPCGGGNCDNFGWHEAQRPLPASLCWGSSW